MLVSTLRAQADSNVIRGYRLHLSNLEDRALVYTVKYWITVATGLASQRSNGASIVLSQAQEKTMST